MGPAEEFVKYLYSTHEGRAPFRVGFTSGFEGPVYPFLYENSKGKALGLVGVTATNEADDSEVQLYHISSFRPGKGYGTEIMNYLCSEADRFGVKIYLQAEVQFSDKETPIGSNLVAWYRKFGFIGNGIMRREAKNA